MAKKASVFAAGTVVFRMKNGTPQVLLIHRPDYDDWTFPKGKPKPDEDMPVAAVRETLEETGVRVRLGVRLDPIRYPVSRGQKMVYYWVGQFLSQRQRQPDAEVDRVKWLDVPQAYARLTYPDEIAVLDQALASDSATRAVLIVRHSKAMQRSHWSGPDENRTLNSRGRRQSDRLVELLAAFGVSRVYSSSSKRCCLTVKPFCRESGVPLEKVDLLTEECAAGHDDEVQAYVSATASAATDPIAFCGHRPVLPAMQRGLGIDPRPMLTAEVLAVHFRDREVVGVESHKSAF